MKRSLVLLLVVAMLAVMMPTMALAEEKTPKLTPNTTTYSDGLTYDMDEDEWHYVYQGFSVAVSDFVDEYGYRRSGTLEFTVSDESMCYYTGTTSRSVWGNQTVSFPSMEVRNKEGAFKLTATLYDENDTALANTSIDVTVKAFKTEKLEFGEKSYAMTVGGTKSFKYEVNPTPWNCYYGREYMKWSVSDESVAMVDKNGKVTALKAGSVVLSVVAKDNAEAKAEVPIAITEEKKEELAPTFTFTTKTFTLKMADNNLDLDDYVIKENVSQKDTPIWTSDNPNAVKVNSDGTLSLIEPGTANITLRSKMFPNASATCSVTLVKEALTSMTFSNVPKSLKYGRSFEAWNYLNTDPYYYSTKYKSEIGWKSSDPQVAYYDEGYVIAANIGKATITAYYKEDETKKAEFELEVVSVPVTGAVFAKEEFTVKAGKSIDLDEEQYLTLNPRDHSYDYTMKWVSSDEEIATVDSYGEVDARKAGTATITLSIRNDSDPDDKIVTATTKVTVVENTLTGIAFKKEAYTVPLAYRKDTKDVALKLTPADANFDADDLYVESSDQKVATASLMGSAVEITAIAPGTATITVKSHSNEALTASTTVTVKPVNLTGVKMVQDEKTVPIYKDAENELTTSSVTLKAAVEPSDAYCKAVWETSDASVAYPRYDEENEGRYTTLYAVGPGTCTISVTATDGTNTFTASMKVTVKVATVSKFELNVTKATVYMVKGEDNTLELKATDVNTGDAVPVKWSTSNKKIATVDQKGVVTFKKAGKVKITATTRDGNDTQKTCTLNIKQLKVSKISVSKAVTLNVGQEKALQVTIKPAKVYNPALSFKSSKPKVVSVDAEGNLKALAPGKSVITITAKDGSKKTAKVTVTVKAGSANNELTVDGNIDDGMDLTIDGDVLGDFGGISQNEIGGAIELTIE